jgi:hypothetical protein
MDALEISINRKVRSIIRNEDNGVIFVELAYERNWDRKKKGDLFKIIVCGVDHLENRFKRTRIVLNPKDIVDIKRISLIEADRSKISKTP